jgi:hypothetical protein
MIRTFGGMKKAAPVSRSACFLEMVGTCYRSELRDPGEGLRGLAFQVSSFVRVNQVALCSLVDHGRESGAGHRSGSLVTGGNRGERLLAEGLHAAFFRTVALGPDNSLTGALDRRFVIGHVRSVKKSVASRRAEENRNSRVGVKLVFQRISAPRVASGFTC